MPEDDYDLAGFAVGVVDKKDIINGEDIKPGDVLVVGVLPDEAAAYASKAAAIIAEEGGLTSSVAIIAINCSIPVVVGAENALNLLKDDMEVTVDTVSGIVYEGAINI